MLQILRRLAFSSILLLFLTAVGQKSHRYIKFSFDVQNKGFRTITTISKTFDANKKEYSYYIEYPYSQSLKAICELPKIVDEATKDRLLGSNMLLNFEEFADSRLTSRFLETSKYEYYLIEQKSDSLYYIFQVKSLLYTSNTQE